MADEEFDLIPDLVEDETQEITYSKIKNVKPEIAGTVNCESQEDKVPVTIITGYLGSGKSTLLQQIGKKGDRKLAIILNEFGNSIDIEKSLTVKDKRNQEVEEWLDLGNGCLCCTVKDNGVAAIERLVAKKQGFDHILLETTGLADPAPIATMFWLDSSLNSNVYIDGVITVLDSENIEECLKDVGGHYHYTEDGENHHHADHYDEDKENISDPTANDKDITTAHLQIALADAILLNKIDKIENDPERIKILESKIKNINSIAPIYHTKFGDIELDKILDLHAYEDSNVIEIIKSKNNNSSFHDHRISTISIDFPKLDSVEDYKKIESFLQLLLWEDLAGDENVESSGQVEIHRTKGLVNFVDSKLKSIVIQGVRKTYDVIEVAHEDGVGSLDHCRLVLIGKNLNLDYIKSKFTAISGKETI